MVKKQDQDNPKKEKKTFLTDIVSHEDAISALKLALRYVEQHTAATPTNVMFMRCWRNVTLSSRFSSLRQTKITDLFQLIKVLYSFLNANSNVFKGKINISFVYDS
ncbi:hypothetical protein AVEN_178147-1 [Araneus ventricosus]|uniref:Uncharacterized protein n=1 Tax=Araneus ventricosus TaxID=182803 RepID=A0A4Y2GDV7_ARAVE|nr:hypothetical protein AVEN_178147-1 [Araneus ventricosus]